MDQGLRISQLETELTLLKLKIKDVKLGVIATPPPTPARMQELEAELAGLETKEKQLRAQLDALRGKASS